MSEKKAMTFLFHEDGGHGWLAVKRSLLESLGIAKQITVFSYQRGQTVYLEEDQDMSLFEDTMKERGIAFTIAKATYYDRSPIRNYDCYDANAA